MCVRRSFWERVTLKEEFVGRFKVGSRLPQYLCTQVRRDDRCGKGMVLYDCDVNRRCGTCAVDRLVCHVGSFVKL